MGKGRQEAVAPLSMGEGATGITLLPLQGRMCQIVWPLWIALETQPFMNISNCLEFWNVCVLVVLKEGCVTVSKSKLGSFCEQMQKTTDNSRYMQNELQIQTLSECPGRPTKIETLVAFPVRNEFTVPIQKCAKNVP